MRLTNCLNGALPDARLFGLALLAVEPEGQAVELARRSLERQREPTMH